MCQMVEKVPNLELFYMCRSILEYPVVSYTEVKDLIRLLGCVDVIGPFLPAYAMKTHSSMVPHK